MSFCYCAEEFDEIISHCCIELKPGHRLQFYMNGLIETCDRVACEALDVGPADLAQALVALLAPGGELAQVQGELAVTWRRRTNHPVIPFQCAPSAAAALRRSLISPA